MASPKLRTWTDELFAPGLRTTFWGQGQKKGVQSGSIPWPVRPGDLPHQHLSGPSLLPPKSLLPTPPLRGGTWPKPLLSLGSGVCLCSFVGGLGTCGQSNLLSGKVMLGAVLAGHSAHLRRTPDMTWNVCLTKMVPRPGQQLS